jgi:FMN phosphatase YigB (HAD superfamily)
MKFLARVSFTAVFVFIFCSSFFLSARVDTVIFDLHDLLLEKVQTVLGRVGLTVWQQDQAEGVFSDGRQSCLLPTRSVASLEGGFDLEHVEDSGFYETLMKIFYVYCPVCCGDCCSGNGARHLKIAWLSGQISTEQLEENIRVVFQRLDSIDWGLFDSEVKPDDCDVWVEGSPDGDFSDADGFLNPEYLAFLDEMGPEDSALVSSLGARELSFFKSLSVREIQLISRVAVILLSLERYVKHSKILRGGVALLNYFKTINEFFQRSIGYTCYQLYIFTNCMKSWVDEYVQHFPEVFRGVTVVCSEDVGVVKPDPQAFIRFVNKYGLDPLKTMYIDHDQACLDAAKGIGIKTLLFDASSCGEFINTVKALKQAGVLVCRDWPSDETLARRCFEGVPNHPMDEDCIPESPTTLCRPETPLRPLVVASGSPKIRPLGFDFYSPTKTPRKRGGSGGSDDLLKALLGPSSASVDSM